MTTNNARRPGNRALEYLLNRYGPLDGKVAFLVNALPALGDQLYVNAQTGVEIVSSFLQKTRLTYLLSTLTKTSFSPQKDRLLALCIFDLELCIYFDSVFSYCGHKELASLLADSLLYQATGYEASSPTDSELWDQGTQRSRGIHKYLLAHGQFKKIGDVQAWVFGKEVSAIVHGNAKDLHTVLRVVPLSGAVRVNAKNVCALSLYGIAPTREEEKAFTAGLEELSKRLTEMANKPL